MKPFFPRLPSGFLPTQCVVLLLHHLLTVLFLSKREIFGFVEILQVALPWASLTLAFLVGPETPRKLVGLGGFFPGCSTPLLADPSHFGTKIHGIFLSPANAAPVSPLERQRWALPGACTVPKILD